MGVTERVDRVEENDLSYLFDRVALWRIGCVGGV